MRWIYHLSSRARARLAGAFEFLEDAASGSGQVALVGSFDIVGDGAFHLAWALPMYQLLKPIDNTLASLALLMVIICSGFQAIAAFFYLASLLTLQGAFGGLTSQQTQGLASVFLALNEAAFHMDLVFFGAVGHLYRPSHVSSEVHASHPRPAADAGRARVELYVWPLFATSLLPVIAVIPGVAELPLQFWLSVSESIATAGANKRPHVESCGRNWPLPFYPDDHEHHHHTEETVRGRGGGERFRPAAGFIDADDARRRCGACVVVEAQRRVRVLVIRPRARQDGDFNLRQPRVFAEPR